SLPLAPTKPVPDHSALRQGVTRPHARTGVLCRTPPCPGIEPPEIRLYLLRRHGGPLRGADEPLSRSAVDRRIDPNSLPLGSCQLHPAGRALPLGPHAPRSSGRRRPSPLKQTVVTSDLNASQIICSTV